MAKKKKPVGFDESLIQNSRSAQMMFKTALRNHLDLSTLADNKANIMLSVNALIITVVMPVTITYVGGNYYYLIPLACLLLTCLSSMTYATLATRPIKMTGYTPLDKIKQGQSNLFFFGNFYRMDLTEYEEGMNQVLADNDKLDGSILRDLYFLGRSLGTKYNQLRKCYNLFMLGIFGTVLVFAVCYVLSLEAA